MADKELLVRAAKCVEQARALNDEYPEKKSMPAEIQRRIDKLLDEASNARASYEREQRMDDTDAFLREPQYKHAPGYGGDGGGKSGSGRAVYGADDDDGEPVYLSDKEKADRQKAAFFSWVRKGNRGMPSEYKADLVEDADGQQLIPPDFVGTILKDLPRLEVVRGLATVRPTTKNRVDVGSVSVAAAGWGKLEVDNADGANPPPDGLGGPPGLDTIEVFDLNALIKIGRDELEDSDENLEGILSDALSLKIAEQEDDAFAAGTGTGQPQGISAESAGIGTTKSAKLGVANPDELKALTFEVPYWAQRNAVWLGHHSAELAVALLKDTTGQYLWQPRISQSEPATFMGYPWYRLDGLHATGTPVAEGATDSGGTNKSVYFGDVRAGYMIADRRRLTVQRLDERYAEEGRVGFLFTMRVGGGVIRPNALHGYLL